MEDELACVPDFAIECRQIAEIDPFDSNYMPWHDVSSVFSAGRSSNW